MTEKIHLTPHYDNWVWAVEKAAECVGATAASVLGKSRQQHLTSARRALYAFLQEKGWSSSQIGSFCNRDHSTILYAISKIDHTPGSQEHEIWLTLHKIYKEQVANAREELETTAAVSVLPVNFRETYYRVSVCDHPHAHYLIEPARAGRAYPSRRLVDGEDGNAELDRLFGSYKAVRRKRAIYLRSQRMPEFMGGFALVETEEADWMKAGGCPPSILGDMVRNGKIPSDEGADYSSVFSG